MMEWMDKYFDAERISTRATIDQPMILFFGLTTLDLIIGVGSCMVVLKLWNSPLALPCSVLAATGSVLLHKTMREKLPPLFFLHLLWALGLLRAKGIRRIFTLKNRGERHYGP